MGEWQWVSVEEYPEGQVWLLQKISIVRSASDKFLEINILEKYDKNLSSSKIPWYINI